MGKTDLLSHFKKLISNQNLDYKIARDIIYKTYVGGMIKVGKMQKVKYGYFAAYNKDLPKEYKFLKAFGYFVENVAYTPELPIISMFKTDNDKFRELASEIAYEVIEEKRDDIEKILNKYNKTFIFCSLYGNNFDFSYDVYQYYQISGSIVRIPFTFDINKENSYFWKLKIVCSFIDILNKIEQLYKELQEIDIGVVTETYHGDKGSYENPLQYSITHIKVPEELLNIIRDYNDIDESLLNKFVSYAIVYEYKNVDLDHAENAENFQHLINYLGIDFELIKEVISELSNKGLTSNLVFDFNQSEDILGKSKNLFVTYDDINLKEYIRQRMKEILTNAQIL
jgi:predicted transcriptional regulator